VEGVAGGANCQQFAYELLRHNGFEIGALRSSELWADTRDTSPVVGPLRPGDLLLFNHVRDAWGAHVALYLGDDRAIHLAKHVGRPAVWGLATFAADPRYACFLGAKRPVRRRAGA
jgi:cell wall-associated NlpC family hydrolase